MSCAGVASGAPCAGDRMLLLESMRIRASACASALRGRWTAIWSPSKSALNAWQTSGWTWMALPSTSTGSNAWMPRRCSVGARLSSTGCSWMTSSRTSQTSGIIESTIFLAALMFWTALRSTSRAMMNGLNSSSAMSLGSPHWCSRRDGPATAAVVEQGVDGLLQHPLLVVDDDLGRAEVQQPLQAVVAVDDAAVEVVEVARGEPAAVELHPRPELRRNDRDRLQDHPLGLVARLDERVRDLQPLDRALLLLALRRLDRVAQRARLVVEVEVAQEIAHCLGAHASAEVDPEAVRRAEPILELTEDLLVADDHLRLELLEQHPRLLEATNRIDGGLARVLAAGLHVRDHLAHLQRPLPDRVEVLLAGAFDEAEVVRQLAQRRRVGLRICGGQHVREQPSAYLPRTLEVLLV